MLKVQNLTACIKKDGKEFKILNDISFTIDEGEVLGVAGESGCGKSMTALSIAKLLPQAVKITNGKIIYKSCDLTPLSEKEMCGIRGKEISVIFQDVRQALNPTMKAGKQITETLELERDHKKINKEQRQKNKELTLEILASLGFNDPQKTFDAFPHQLSGGMCQRIMTAIAAIRRPKLLLGDEPSSSLDEESQRQCLSMLMKMNRDYKMSLLLISHDLSIIQQYCSRFIIMYAGRIVEEGPAEMFFSPLHPYTLALLKAIPHKDKRGKILENIPGKVPSVEDQLPGCPFAPRCPKAQSICKETFPPEYFHRKGEVGAQSRKVYCYFPVGEEKTTTAFHKEGTYE